MFSTKKCWILSIVCLALASASPVLGEAQGWAVAAGSFDIEGDPTPEAGVEFRFSPLPVGGVQWLGLVPAMGVSGTSDGGVWLYGNVRLDLEVSDHWVITPQFAVTLFEDGDGKDLGGPVEFRSGLEVSYRFGRGSRLGVLFYHLSNARIYDDNPGSNSLVLVWAIGR